MSESQPPQERRLFAGMTMQETPELAACPLCDPTEAKECVRTVIGLKIVPETVK